MNEEEEKRFLVTVIKVRLTRQSDARLAGWCGDWLNPKHFVGVSQYRMMPLFYGQCYKVAHDSTTVL